jgi:DNA polymerase-1
MGVKEVLDKYGLKNVSQVIDLLGLMGDTADNIPGCPGVGEKTAQKLLVEFDSVENLLENTDKLKGAIQKKVSENAEMIRFSKFLATIRTDAPIEFDAESCVRREPNNEELIKIYRELEFRAFINKIEKNNGGAEDKKVNTPTPSSNSIEKNPAQRSLFDLFDEPESEINVKDESLKDLSETPHTYSLLDDDSQINTLVDKLSKDKGFAFSAIADGTDPITSNIIGISVSEKRGEAYYIPFSQSNKKDRLEILKPVFENENIEKVGHNIKFGIILLRRNGVRVRGKLFDTMLAHYLLNPELNHDMEYLTETYLRYKSISIVSIIGAKGKKQRNLGEFPATDILDYVCEASDQTLRLKEFFGPLMKSENVDHLFYEIEMPLVYVLADMEYTGVTLDTEALKESTEYVANRILELENEIYDLAGMEFKINSTKQVGEVLFERLKLDEKAKKTKSGSYSTSEDILDKLKAKHPIIGKILEYRGLKKLLSTYMEALPELINPQTGRIHTSYNQAVTSTGRLSSTNPNLQNIPIRDEMGKVIRKAFVPNEPGCTFFSADYSQIELRIMAHLSKDVNMIEAFRSGEDIHAATAAKIYGVDIKDVTSDMRRKAKTANFGIIYGISVFGLAERLDIPRTEAKELIDGYFLTYPGVKAYIDESINIAKEKGYAETIYNRRRYLPDINSGNAIVRGYAERNAVNAPIQGSAADIIKVAMIRIFNRFEKEGLKSKMILQVHDELNFSVPEDELSKVREIVLEEMENVVKLSVPMIADCGSGKNWLEAH